MFVNEQDVFLRKEVKMKNLICLLILFFLLVSCTPKPEQIAPYLFQTQTAWPTQTPYATYTPQNTYTPFPTYTPINTYTPIIKVVTGTSSPTPVYTPTSSQTPTITFTPSPTTDPLKAPHGDGFYLINIDIAPGIWRSNGTGDSCYWEVSTKTGDIISNHFGMSGGTAYLPATGFQIRFEDCGTWEFLSP